MKKTILTSLILYFTFFMASAQQAGNLDSTFSSDGKQTTSFGSYGSYGNSVAVQKDSKIVVAGYFHNGKNADFALARYNGDGSLDNTFSSDGKQTTAIGSGDDIGQAVAIQTDGKIVVAGYSVIGGNFDFAVVRYNSDGSLDSTFSGDGKQTTAIGSKTDQAFSVVIQPNGKIVVVGQAVDGNGYYDFAVVRYNSDGSPDNTFSGDGIQTTTVGGNDYGFSVAIQTDSKIVIAGWSEIGNNRDFAIVRFKSDGSLDSNFSGDGKQTTSIGSGYDYGFAVAIQKDNKIVVVGQSNGGGNYDFAIVRYNSNGSLDSTFSGDGKQTTSIGSGGDWGQSVAIQKDGQIVLAGYSSDGTYEIFTVIRYNQDGSLDKSFSGDGIQTTAFVNGYDKGNSIVIQSDRKIVVAGYSLSGSSSNFAIVRYWPGICEKLISTQPQNTQANVGATANFTITSSASTFQWQLKQGSGWQNLTNTGQYSGATTNTLTIKNLTTSNNSQNYRCVATSNPCADTSTTCILTVCSKSITTQPQNTQANAGATANFTITSSASTFQWQLKQGSGWQNLTNTGQYSGATTNTLTIKNLTTSNNNQNYRCVATSNPCADTSTTCILTVCSKSITTQPQNTQANAGATANFTITSSASTFQWQLKQGSGWQNLTNTGQYSGATTNTLTIKNLTTSNNSQNYRCVATSNPCADTSTTCILTVCSKSITTQPQNTQANAGATANFTITSSASTFQWQLKQGSGWQNLTNTGQYTGATTNTLTIKNITTSNNNQNYRCIATINTCADTSSIGILTVKTGKIEDFKHQNLISVFPNPANNKLTIQSSTNPVDLPYSIIDQSGRELLKGSLNAKITTIDISQLAIGFYFLQVGETNKETFKLMKQ